MSVSAKPSPPAKGQFLVYQTEDGQLKIDVRLEGETAWLTQAHMAELFQTTVPNVSMHLRNVYAEGELQAAATVKEFLTTAADGKNYTTKYYNLFQTVQNKMHWAITGNTAAEIIHTRADAVKPHMGLTNWRGAKVRKHDVTIAKNYLNEQELAVLNNLVEQYLVSAEGQAMRRAPMHMRDWITKLHGFLTLNERAILNHAGKISHEMAKELAEAEYEKFQREQIQQADQAGGDFDRAVKQLPSGPKRTKASKK
jgi:hypothetical protein